MDETFMNQGIDSYIREQFGMGDVDVRTYSPLTLAYIGDSVFDLVIRSAVVAGGNARANQLHGRTSHIVKAATQAQIAETLKPHLTEEEADIYRRGRNAKSPTMAKNASMSDYRSATGLEALIGYLYLTDRFARIVELTKSGLDELNIKP
jgi:ribonuclease-3 family protein